MNIKIIMAIMNMPPMGYLPRASTAVEKAEAPPVKKLGRDLPKKSSKNPPKLDNAP
jgi:hypothetical protein